MNVRAVLEFHSSFVFDSPGPPESSRHHADDFLLRESSWARSVYSTSLGFFMVTLYCTAVFSFFILHPIRSATTIRHFTITVNVLRSVRILHARLKAQAPLKPCSILVLRVRRPCSESKANSGSKYRHKTRTSGMHQPSWNPVRSILVEDHAPSGSRVRNRIYHHKAAMTRTPRTLHKSHGISPEALRYYPRKKTMLRAEAELRIEDNISQSPVPEKIIIPTHERHHIIPHTPSFLPTFFPTCRIITPIITAIITPSPNIIITPHPTSRSIIRLHHPRHHSSTRPLKLTITPTKLRLIRPLQRILLPRRNSSSMRILTVLKLPQRFRQRRFVAKQRPPVKLPFLYHQVVQ